MAEDFGTGVSRTLTALHRSFGGVIMQGKRPPLDAEFNLGDQIALERSQEFVRSLMPSGFLMDPVRTAEDYETSVLWSNQFRLGNQKSGELGSTIWANVNGWVLPIVGTDVDSEGETFNVIKLYPPPSIGTRTDFVFLEAWMAVVRPNPSTTNKPSASKLYKYGNTLYGGTNVDDDIEDPTAGFETAKRTQIQYRIRVYGSGLNGVDLENYPEGLEDPNILAQGTASSPVAGMAFSNMREALGDPSLWRAGDGNPDNGLGSVDGYVYAIPICAVFRRNTDPFVAVNIGGTPNQNGAFDRNPSAAVLPNPLDGSKALLQASLTNAITHTQTGVVSVTNLNGSGLEDSSLVLADTYLVIDGEVVGISAVNTGASTITIPVGGRGRFGTHASGHQAGTAVGFFNSRPDGYFADQVTPTDILDMRRAVQAGGWDYERLLTHNLLSLAKGDLRSTWKRAAAGDTKGSVVTEVSYLFADGSTAVPNHTIALDGPDGCRTVWSDAAVIQQDVTVLLDNDVVVDARHMTSAPFDSTASWDVNPGFNPTGFLNYAGGTSASWTNGSVILLDIGGASGTAGARGTFRDGSTEAVRFLMPSEYWKSDDNLTIADQAPVKLRFLSANSHEPAAPGESSRKHPGPMYPVKRYAFERPFMVLGQVLHSNLKVTRPTSAITLQSGTIVTGEVTVWNEVDLGVDFDAWSDALLNGRRDLADLLTDGGRDYSGHSSEVYLVMYGDPDSTVNNGVFRVVGAGTSGYTQWGALNATSVVVLKVNEGSTSIFNPDINSNNVECEIRSPYSIPEDTVGASMAVVLTDIGGVADHAWNASELGSGEVIDHSIPNDGVTNVPSIASKVSLTLTLQYNPGRSGTARIPNTLRRIAVTNGVGYLRQSPGSRDATFSGSSALDEASFDPVHVSLWSRLGGFNFINQFLEESREHEVFVDEGSKTLIFRPLRDRAMTMQGIITEASPSLIGSLTYPSTDPKDALGLWTANKKLGFAVPPEYMPRFGRQDIPYYEDVASGTGTFLSGINHLFTDSVDASDPVFYIIGGEDNTSGGLQVTPLHFHTGAPSQYGESDTVIGAVVVPCYFARKTSDISTATPEGEQVISALNSVFSSDFGRGLKGIQMPPYMGLARVMGVYEKSDFEAKGGRTFKSNRWEVEVDPATNLLRTDATNRTLYILQDGARDLTGSSGDHTYIIPSNAIDITRIPGYAVADRFEDYDYVVVAVVFGFARNWINGNNYVLARAHAGDGTAVTDGDDPELEDVHMILPCAAGSNERLYTLYDRTVYQGDPFMTRSGATRTVSDYEARYGQVATSDAYQIGTTMDQFDADGDLNVETPNARAFEVLASVDFYTTLGTGKLGGTVVANTVLDVGHIQNDADTFSRIPSTETAPQWEVMPRTFTEGQKTNTSRATLRIAWLRLPSAGITLTASFYRRGIPLGSLSSGSPPFVIDGSSEQVVLTGNDSLDFGTFYPGQEKTLTIAVTGAKTTDTCFVTPPSNVSVWSNADGDSQIMFDAWVSAANTVTVRAVHTGTYRLGGTFNHTFGVVADGATSKTQKVLAGVSPGDVVVVNPANPVDGVLYDAFVSDTDEVTIRVTVANGTSANIVADDYYIHTLDPYDSITTAAANFGVTVIRPTGSLEATVQNFVDAVNSSLSRYVTARREGNTCLLEAVEVGAEGNHLAVRIQHNAPGTADGEIWRLLTPEQGSVARYSTTYASFSGGVDLPVNGGSEFSFTALDMMGVTERLPLGILLQDSDFLCEDPLNNLSSPFMIKQSGVSPVPLPLPRTTRGAEYSLFFGAPGELLGMSDGAVLQYEPWRNTTGTGTKRFRLYRGSGSVFALSGEHPGGPVTWVSDAFTATQKPVLKGALLSGRAMLVRSFYEEALSPPQKVCDGDEIQMVVLTYGHLSYPELLEQQGLSLGGTISPSGFGEGYAAADRYRIEGRPMLRAYSREVRDPSTVEVAPNFRGAR